jgi:hypothetical protein
MSKKKNFLNKKKISTITINKYQKKNLTNLYQILQTIMPDNFFCIAKLIQTKKNFFSSTLSNNKSMILQKKTIKA